MRRPMCRLEDARVRRHCIRQALVGTRHEHKSSATRECRAQVVHERLGVRQPGHVDSDVRPQNTFGVGARPTATPDERGDRTGAFPERAAQQYQQGIPYNQGAVKVDDQR